MVLYLIGLGLCDEKNITLRGLEYIKSSDYIYEILHFNSFSKQIKIRILI